MTHWLHHSLVLASDTRASQVGRIRKVLEQRRGDLVEHGAHHVLVYASTANPKRVLVIIAVHAREPLLDLLRARIFFDLFDAAGVEDIPAVFAGQLLERFDLNPDPNGLGTLATIPDVVVSMVTPVDDLTTLRQHVRDTSEEMRLAGVRRVVIFNAFDDPLEVMMLLQIDDEPHARHWLNYSELAAEWLTKAGIGAYPPVFVGRVQSLLRIDDTEGRPRRP